MTTERRSYWPFLVGAGATLKASALVLVRRAAGTLTPDVVDRMIADWRHSILDAGNVTIDVTGRDNVERGASYVVMFNHRSHVDIPALFEAFPLPLRGVSKAELGRVPVWGHAMRALGFIFVDRGDRQRAIAQLETAKTLLRQGISVFVAPEGTRSRDGTLLPFKKGGFHLARDLGVPIVPVWIEGTAQVMKPDSFAIHAGGHITATIGKPIPSDADVDTLIARVRGAMEAMAAGGTTTTPPAASMQ